MAHAKIMQPDDSSGRKGFEMSSYDTDLWFNYPDVMRRSASEAPLSEFRSPHPHAQSRLAREGEASKLASAAKRKSRGDSHAIKHVLHDESVKMRLGSYEPPPRTKKM